MRRVCMSPYVCACIQTYLCAAHMRPQNFTLHARKLIALTDLPCSCRWAARPQRNDLERMSFRERHSHTCLFCLSALSTNPRSLATRLRDFPRFFFLLLLLSLSCLLARRCPCAVRVDS